MSLSLLVNKIIPEFQTNFKVKSLATKFLGQMTTIFYSISHSSLAITILLYLYYSSVSQNKYPTCL